MRHGRGRLNPVRVLWAVPRSTSTAFERMVIERGDHTVFDEPYSAVYYHGPQRRSPRFAESMSEATPEAVTARLLAEARQRPVFAKDMAYHAGPALMTEAVSGFEHSFLVRDPRWTVPSMARIWPDVTEEEAGFTWLERGFDHVSERLGRAAPLINSDDLLADPAGMVELWCATSGLLHDPSSLAWAPGRQPQWELWLDWYAGTAASTGFGPPPAGEPPAVDDPRLAELVERCLVIYRRLAPHRLLVVPPARTD